VDNVVQNILTVDTEKSTIIQLPSDSDSYMAQIQSPQALYNTLAITVKLPQNLSDCLCLVHST